MEKYNYYVAVTEDVKDWIVNNTDLTEEGNSVIYDDNISDWIYDEVFSEDCVTGNGPYGYDTEEKCSEYLSNNFYLIYEAMREYCLDDDNNFILHHYEMKDLARFFDSVIRCYILPQCVEKAINELKEGK